MNVILIIYFSGSSTPKFIYISKIATNTLMHLQATATVKIQDIFLKYHSSDRWNLLTFHFRTVTTSGSFCPRTVEIRIEKIIQNLKQGMKKSGDVQIHKGRFLSDCFMLLLASFGVILGIYHGCRNLRHRSQCRLYWSFLFGAV
jgi:hypothetical protein